MWCLSLCYHIKTIIQKVGKKKENVFKLHTHQEKKQKPYTHLSPPPPPPFRIHHYTATHKKQNPHKFSKKKPGILSQQLELPSNFLRAQRVSTTRHHSKIEKKKSSSFTDYHQEKNFVSKTWSQEHFSKKLERFPHWYVSTTSLTSCQVSE